MLSLEPQPLWEIFSDICAIPHETGNTGAIRQYLINWAKQHALEIKQDEYNILLTKNASSGLQKAPTICIQAHMDMVCTSDLDIEYNPTKDPIVTILSKDDNDKDIVRAQGTSLGADDGIGIAMSLLLFLEKDIQLGKIEVLITDYEEAADMLGSKNLNETWLTSKYLINIDRTRDGSDNFIQIKSGGGFDGIISFNDIYYIPNSDITENTTQTQSVNDENSTNQDQPANNESQMKKLDEILNQLEAKRKNRVVYSVFTLILRGFASGGSTNIDDIMAPDALRVCLDLIDGQLSGKEQLVMFKCGEVAALKPQSAIIQFAFTDKNDAQTLQKKVTAQLQYLQQPKIYTTKIDKIEMHTFIEDNLVPPLLIDEVKSRKILTMLHSLPKGLIREAGNQAQCNINIGLIDIGPNVEVPSINFRARAVEEEMLQTVQSTISDIVKVLQVGKFQAINEYYPWALDKELMFYQIAQQAFAEIFKQQPKVIESYSGHEIGNIVHHYQNIRAIGIGPAIRNAHTSSEYVEVQSVQHTYDALKNLIQHIYISEGINL